MRALSIISTLLLASMMSPALAQNAGTFDPPEFQGNVGSLAASSSLKKAVADRGEVTFDVAEPSLPGLALSKGSGVVYGTPKSPFKGSISISYHDATGGRGTITLPVSIHPMPKLASERENYELPRLSQASEYGIVVKPANDGYYGGVTYSIAPGSAPLPPGLSLADGAVVGATSARAGISQPITIRGTSDANPSIYADRTVTIIITPERPQSR